jgi:hypothetical protein
MFGEIAPTLGEAEMVRPWPAAFTGCEDRRWVVLPVADFADLVAAVLGDGQEAAAAALHAPPVGCVAVRELLDRVQDLIGTACASGDPEQVGYDLVEPVPLGHPVNAFLAGCPPIPLEVVNRAHAASIRKLYVRHEARLAPADQLPLLPQSGSARRAGVTWRVVRLAGAWSVLAGARR